MTQSRAPWFYAALGVPDTLEGRFELLVLHMFLVLDRLASEAAAEPLAQSLVDVFIADMDATLREIGVGDLSVPKKMRQMAAAFHERLGAYSAAAKMADGDVLRALIGQHLLQDKPRQDHMAAIAAYMDKGRRRLMALDTADLGAGEVAFPEPEMVME